MTAINDPPRLDLEITIQPQRVSGMFDAFFYNRQLCASDRPLRDAAIELLELGAPPNAMLTAWHPFERRQEITTRLDIAAGGFDVGFDVEEPVVVPFHRKAANAINPGGGDAA
jgi:hypothetical protein